MKEPLKIHVMYLQRLFAWEKMAVARGSKVSSMRRDAFGHNYFLAQVLMSELTDL